MKSITKLLAMLFSMAILLSACGDDDDDDNNDADPGNTIDISDPVAVADEITVENATVVVGNPPAPSTDADAPSLDALDIDDDLISTQGGQVLFDLDVNSGDVAGTYVQIVGSDSYFDIPFNPSGRYSFKNGRTQQDDVEPVIEIEIPDNLGIGTFCAEVCVYDADLRVSNIVEICVEITELGGSNSDFLSDNTWEAVSFEETVDGVTDVSEVGELVVDTFTTSLLCADGQTFEDVEVTESDRLDEIKFTFSENGAVQVTISEFERDLDYENSTCEDQVYEEEEFEATLTGTWSFDEATSTLILVLEITSSTDVEEIGEVEVIEFTVEFDEDSETLRLTQDFDDDDDDGDETIVFQPV